MDRSRRLRIEAIHLDQDDPKMHSKEVGKSWADQMQEQDFHGPKEGDST